MTVSKTLLCLHNHKGLRKCVMYCVADHFWWLTDSIDSIKVR